MKNKYFQSRKKCPGCSSTKNDNIYQSPYDKPPIRDYLHSFYSRQGGVDFRYLENAVYHLVKCKQCELIYQKEIPSESLMKIFYENWIDPTKTQMSEQNMPGIGIRHNYAKEISIIIEQLRKNPTTLNFLDFGMGWGGMGSDGQGIWL
jgi:hypothetical protein